MDRSLLSTRATLVLLLAVLAGAAAGLLSALAGDGTARCALCGLAAAGGALPVINQVITPDRTGGEPRLQPSGDDHG
ncbi:hypothetical protein ACFY2W_01530 [Streptomyces sp. NPDC001262]|uniref:hypothetical protein n=1 Tax=unclassified Streptomyces TaxID=2593676 RepID=UPI00367E770E